MNLGLIIFIVAILLVVMIHESGHFFVAKFFNFKATKYFIGFGPTVWSVHRGETEYGVKALPLGGFVKIVGMNPYEEIPVEDQPRSYPNKPIWQRALVIVAGSATHFVVAFLILFVTAMTLGFPTGEPSNQVAVVDTQVSGGESPAAAAGILPDDKVVAANGTPTETWDEVRGFIQQHPGEEVTFTIERDGERQDVTAVLGSAIFGSDGEVIEYAPPGDDLVRTPPPGAEVVGFLGIQPQPLYETLGPISAVGRAGSETWQVTKLSFVGIGDMFGMVFGGELFEALGGEGERSVDEGPLGIVGAGRIASESASTGQALDLVALIVGFTVFVGLMNLLPLPPLDGGHLAVLAWEKITGKAVDVRKLIPVATAVISFFVIVFVAVLYLDLARPIRVPF
jgi:membrane-associated protease RseP (regulator of RpoE activity)